MQVLGWGFCSNVAGGREALGGAPEPAPITASGTLPGAGMQERCLGGQAGCSASCSPRDAGGEEEWVKGSRASLSASASMVSPPAKLQPARSVVLFQKTSFGVKDGLKKYESY